MFKVILVICCFLLACKPSMLPNTSVPDTKENRAVADFMEQYRTAVISRSVQDILSMVSPDYFENSGTIEAHDDCNYTQLKEKLKLAYDHTKEIRLRLHIQNIIHKKNQIMVFYFYSQHSLENFPSGDQWITTSDVARIVLKIKGNNPSDGFEIISGL